MKHASAPSNNVMIAGIALGAIIIAILLAILVKSNAEEHECEKKMGFYNQSTKTCTNKTSTGKPIEANTQKISFTETNKEVMINSGTTGTGIRNGAEITLANNAEITQEIASVDDPLQPPRTNDMQRKRYILSGGRVSFSLETNKSDSQMSVLRGNKSLLYATRSQSGSITPALFVSMRGQLSAPEYINRLAISRLSIADQATCKIYETKTSSAGTLYYTLRGAGCSRLDSLYRDAIITVNDTRMPGLITLSPETNTTLDLESIQIPDIALIK